MIPPLHISLLGDFLLVSGETPVTALRIPRVQFLLAYLVLHRKAPQNRSHLAFLFWPDSSESQAHTNLRQLLHHLRQSLPHADHFLRADKQSLQWLPADPDTIFTLDVQEMEEALDEAKRAEDAQEAPALRQALERVLRLYQGDLLPNCYEEWILPERDRLRQLFLQAAERLLALTEQERDYKAAIAVARHLLRVDPLDEATTRKLMRLYALHGERAAALRTYHTCAKLLERELGIEPSELTQAMYASLRQANPSASIQASRHAKQRTEAPLQGRKAEWLELQKAWDKASGGIGKNQPGSPHFVVLSGEAGIGKTRLAQELEVRVGKLGMTTASARCYATLEHLAYAPVAAWLRSDALQRHFAALDPTSLTEVARLLPEVLITHPHLSPPAPMSEGWQRQFFLAALTRAVLSVRQPLLLLLDDLHWCDQETLEWLHYLLRFAPDARLLLVGTVRTEETAQDHPLAAFLRELQRDGLMTEIPLGPLTQAETTSLAECLLDRRFDSAMSERLYRESEGNPLFVVEMVRAGTVSQETPRPSTTQGLHPLYAPTSSLLPPAIQAVLTTRLTLLSARAGAVANVAAVIGREFSFPVLLHASGEREEEVVQGLDELWQRRLVREPHTGTANAYDFSHDKLRVYIYASLSSAHRRLLHQRVAEALKTVYREDLETVCGQIALHYERAGLPAQAIPFYQQAGAVARRIYAHTEALHEFQQAAALLEQARQNVPWETAAQVYTSCGDIYAETGACEEARQAYQHALTHLPAEAHIWQARLYWKIATTWTYSFARKHDPFYEQSLQAFAKAERLLTQIADPSNPDWREEWLDLQFARIWRGSVNEIETALQRARPIVEQHGTQEQRKLFAEAVGIHNAIRDRFVIPTHRLASWRATIASLEPGGDETQRGIDLALLGIGLLSASQFDEAEEQLRQALHVGERTGNAWLQNNCLTFLPFVLRQRGQVEEVSRLIAQAQSLGLTEHNRIFSGHRAWVAWRQGNLVLAETYGRESVEEPHTPQVRPNPFLWTGRWPLIGIALTRQQVASAIHEIRLLFDPTQQPPRPPLDALLRTVLQTWEAGEPEKASAHLQQAVPLATQMGYL